MINPAVISLASLQKFKNLDFPFRFEIEDNIGEAIHVHFKDIRIDLTVREFEELACECEKILENLIDCGDFKFRDFDPMLLTAISGDLSRIERIERREVFLEEILVDTFDENGNKIFAPIYESRVFKALQGADFENEEHFQLNYLSLLADGEISNRERISFNLTQIKKYGYPHGNELIGIDHHNRIWDDQHRAACLYYLYGNIKVPVRTIYFRDDFEIENSPDSEWIETERELLEKARIADAGKNKRTVLHFLKAAMKRILWCSWKKADVIKSKNFRRLSQIDDRLSSIEQKLSEKR